MRIALALLLAVLVSPAHAGELMHHLFRCTSDERCVIKSNRGGDVDSFHIAASEARAHGTQIRISGQCESACVIFASEVRDQVCLTRRARMRIHIGIKSRMHDRDGRELDGLSFRALSYDPPKGYIVRWSTFVPDYGADINEWAKRGKRLHPNPAVFTTMTHGEAMRFWKPCR